MANKISQETLTAICQRVKEYYDTHSIYASVFAERCGINKNTLYNIVNNHRDFQVSLLYKIKSEFPDFDVDYCLFGKDTTRSFNNNGGVFIQHSNNNSNISAGSTDDMKQTISAQMDEIIESNQHYREMIKQTTTGMLQMMNNMDSISDSFKNIVIALQQQIMQKSRNENE